MGAKTWMLVYADEDARKALECKPELDREASRRLAIELFPNETLDPFGDGSLAWTNPSDKELYIGCFPGVAVVAAKEFGIDYASKLPQRYINAGAGGIMVLHAMHSVVDWFAFAKWEKGELARSLSLSPDRGILEDIGERLPFEEPFWATKHPAIISHEEKETYPFAFHPLDLGEAALKEFFGYQLEGEIDSSLLDPEAIPLERYKRIRAPWWKIWANK
jgi:hypothetical protein